MFRPDELTDDGFLGQRLRILQPRRGYRAATDPVLLAAAVPAQTGQSVLELGCGVGVASLCLAARVPGLGLSALERQPAYAALARENASRNDLDLTVVEGDLAAMPDDLRRSFDHVIANPPYFAAGDGTAATDAGREAATADAVAAVRQGRSLTEVLAQVPAPQAGVFTVMLPVSAAATGTLPTTTSTGALAFVG